MREILFVLAVGMAQAAAGGPASGPRLILLESAVVHGAHVRFDEIVADPCAAALPVALSSVWIGEAPAAGETRVITRQEAALRLAQIGIRDVELSGEGVRVHREGEGVPSARKDVCVARRALPAGALLSEGDIERRPVLPGERTAGFLPAEELVGKELARGVAAGVPFAREAVRDAVCVRKGDTVRVVTGSEGVSIAFPARVERDARRGETVTARPARDPGSVLRVVVVGRGRARLAGGEGL